ncbi:Esterase YbfF [bacterium HR40]|nr:Esterase YbfF [bacterium HR40]
MTSPAPRSGAVSLACERFGEGPPLVFLHGLFGSGRNFRSIARAFAPRFTCFLVDLRNHGQSPHARPADYPAMAADLFALLDRQGLAAADLVGHSMAGKVAMYAALADPARVRRLAVLDIAPIRYRHDHRQLIDALLALELSTIRRRADADAALAAAVPDASLRAFLLQNLVFDAEGRAAWRVALAILREDMDRLLDFPLPNEDACFRGPALFLRGGRSAYVPAEAEHAIRRLFPRAEFATIADAGHWLHAERPEDVRRALASFLAHPRDRRSAG